METEENEETTQVDNSGDVGDVVQVHSDSDEEPEVGPDDSAVAASWSNHGTKVLLRVKKGKLKGNEILHFKCSYCRDKHFQGPSSTVSCYYERNPTLSLRNRKFEKIHGRISKNRRYLHRNVCRI